MRIRPWLGLLGALSLASACGGPARFPGGADDCGVEVRGLGVASATCFPSDDAQVLALRADAAGGALVVGTFGGRLALDPAHPVAASVYAQTFAAHLDASMAPRFVRALDAPGTVRGVAIGARGIAVVSSGIEPRAGPWLTRLDASGQPTLRKDLAFGGLVSGVSFDPRGALVMRTQVDGLRVIVTDEDGKIVLSPRVAPSWIHQLPPSVAEGAIVSEIAVTPEGIVVAHARGPSEDGGVPDHALTRVAPSGRVEWTRPVPIGAGAQIAAAGDAIVALSPEATALCPTAAGQGFAVTLLDREANVRWMRCYAGRTTALRLAADASGRIVVAGQATGRVDLGDGPREAGSGVASFVVRLGDGGHPSWSAWLTGPRHVANHAVALGADGSIVVAGATSRGPLQTHVYVARLTE